MDKQRRKEEIKLTIKRKFKSIHKFCFLSNMSYQKVSTALEKRSNPKDSYLDEIEMNVRNIRHSFLSSEISDFEREDIRERLYSQYDSIKDFCRKEGFRSVAIYSLLNGKTIKKSKRYYEVAAILNK